MSEQEPLFACPTREHVSILGDRAIHLFQLKLTELGECHKESQVDRVAYNKILSAHGEMLETLSMLAGKCAVEKGLPKPKNCPVPSQIEQLVNQYPQLDPKSRLRFPSTG